MSLQNHWILQKPPQGLMLQNMQDPRQFLQIDFNTGTQQFRRLHGGGLGQPIAKAIGIKKYPHPPVIIDATIGLGKDAFVLASLGCRIIGIERNPLLFELLQDALTRASTHSETAEIAQRITLIQGDALLLLPSISVQYKPDIIYLDPMFPERQKSALVKKDMQILKDLLGEADNQDAESLFTVARSCAKKVVVKRPKTAPLLSSAKPTWQWVGESNRFDVYQL